MKIASILIGVGMLAIGVSFLADNDFFHTVIFFGGACLLASGEFLALE